MAEILALVSSIVQVASFGLSLSKTLHDYGAAVVGIEKRLKGLDKDIDFTSRIISQLGTRLQDTKVQAIVSEDTIRLTQDAVAECQAIFQAMEDVIAKIRSAGSMAKWTIYFRDSKIELLRSNLDRMKGNLNLLMGVIIHGTQMAAEEPHGASVSSHRARIRELMIEKEHYTQKYLMEKKKYDMLLEKINSTSTLGSFIMLTTAGDAPALPPPPANGANILDEPGATEKPEASESHQPPFQADGIAFEAHRPPAPLSPVIELSSWAPSTHPPRVSVSSSSASEPNAPPNFAASDIAAPTLAGPTSPAIAVRSSPTPRRRVKIAKAAKKTAKGAGIALVVVFGIATFPLMVPAYMMWRRRRRLQRTAANSPPPASMHDHTPNVMPPTTLHQDQFPMSYWQYHEGVPAVAGLQHQHQHQPWYSSPTTAYYSPSPYEDPQSYASAQSHMTYDSSRIPAELPAMHELASGPSPDIELVGRLLHTDRPPATYRPTVAELPK